MKSESTCLDNANSFKGSLTRELFAEAEIENNFRGCLLRSLFLDDQSIPVKERANKVEGQDQVSFKSSKQKNAQKRAAGPQP